MTTTSPPPPPQTTENKEEAMREREAYVLQKLFISILPIDEVEFVEAREEEDDDDELENENESEKEEAINGDDLAQRTEDHNRATTPDAEKRRREEEEEANNETGESPSKASLNGDLESAMTTGEYAIITLRRRLLARLEEEESQRKQALQRSRRKHAEVEVEEESVASLRMIPKIQDFKGLLNLGFTCYVNAVVQALMSCSCFADVVLNEPALDPAAIPPAALPVLRNLMILCRETRKETQSSASFTSTEDWAGNAPVRQLRERFTGKGDLDQHDQQDAPEFLMWLLNSLHEEQQQPQQQHHGNGHMTGTGEGNLEATNGATRNARRSGDQKRGDEGDDEEDADDGWAVAQKKRNKSRKIVKNGVTGKPTFVSAAFAGTMRDIITYASDGSTSIAEKHVWLIPLTVNKSSVSSIEDALVDNFSDEYLAKLRKREEFKILPRVLVLHILRFDYNDERTRKNGKSVKIPLEIDVKRFVSPEQIQQMTQLSPDAKFKYVLKSSVNHLGNRATSGHYLAVTRAYAEEGETWLKFDDTIVTRVKASAISSEGQPYLLLYERAL